MPLMIFKRKKPLSFAARVREFIMPSMGWRRTARYVHLRLMRLNDTSQKVAAGLAIGVAVSFSPLVGTHLLQAALFAYLFRANVISALIGTLAGNPWTFPFMWLLAIWFGEVIFSLMGIPVSTVIPVDMDFAKVWALATKEPLRIFLPWLVGGYWIALIIAPILYMVFFNMIRTARRAHKKRRAKKRRTPKEETNT